jgi:hypothetical protein
LLALRRLGYDASSGGAIFHEGKRLFNVNGHLMTFEEARAPDGRRNAGERR